MTQEPLVRLGRADMHIHTLASDGTAGVGQILDHVARQGFLDVIAIADHERVDAAIAAKHMAEDRGLPFSAGVGSEITTSGGHLLALFVEKPVPSLKGLAWSIEAVHDQGGIAIPAHPLVPYPLCAQGPALRRLLASDNPAVRPDTIETFNPTALGKYRHDAVVRFADEGGMYIRSVLTDTLELKNDGAAKLMPADPAVTETAPGSWAVTEKETRPAPVAE